MYNLRCPNSKDDFFTYDGEDGVCECWYRAARLMTPNFEKYISCPLRNCKIEKKLEVVVAEDLASYMMRVAMREKLVELEVNKDAKMAKLDMMTTAKLSLKDKYIEELENDMEEQRKEVESYERRVQFAQ
ncbi:hypothetical protein LINGRAPRIM_LOCUS487 [Linum grandiflorum]